MATEWSEAKFSKTLTDKLKKYNAFVVNFSGNRFQMEGISDLRVTHVNWRGWIELKVDKRKMTPAQVQFSQVHADRGDNALGVWYMNETESIRVRIFVPDEDPRLYEMPSIDDFVTSLLRRRKSK